MLNLNHSKRADFYMTLPASFIRKFSDMSNTISITTATTYTQIVLSHIFPNQLWTSPSGKYNNFARLKPYPKALSMTELRS